MITSDNALIFTYTLWLIGRRDFGLDFRDAARCYQPMVLHGSHNRPLHVVA